MTQAFNVEKSDNERLSLSAKNQAKIKLGDLPAEIRKETAEADVKRVRVLLKKERTKNMMETLRREKGVRTTLLASSQTEQRRKLTIMRR